MGTYALKQPLDDDARTTLAELLEATTALNIQACLIGAQARIIWLQHIYGLTTARPTEDTDFAVQIEHWEQFEELGARLANDHQWRKDSKQAQRFYSAAGRMVDLVPCGPVAEDDVVFWPPERSHRMDVRGFELAMSDAVDVTIDEGLSIKIAPLPVLALLKLVSWWDRSHGNQKDAEDLITLLRNFADTDGATLLEAEANFDLYDLEDDHDLRGAHLLGRVVASTAEEDTLELARRILEEGIDEAGEQRLVLHGARAMPGDEASRADSAYSILMAFQRGLEG